MQLTPGHLATVCALSLLAGVPGLATAQNSAASPLVASSGATRIVEADLDEWWQQHDAATFQRTRRELFEGRKRALDALLSERLLQAEAARRGRSAEELLEQEVARRTKPVTDAEIATFLAASPMPAGASPSVVAPLVAALLGQRARQAAREEYLDVLRNAADAGVEVYLQPPQVSVERALHNPVLGPPDARVSVVVFSDFECPYCRQAQPVLARLMSRYSSEVHFVWKHYPLAIHRQARAAAEAAQCAHDQGRFWAYHDALFADGGALQPATLFTLAARLGLDGEVFTRCVTTQMHAPDVASDIAAAERAGVAGTPTVFINDVAYVGALPYETYERAIRSGLARAVMPVSLSLEPAR